MGDDEGGSGWACLVEYLKTLLGSPSSRRSLAQTAGGWTHGAGVRAGIAPRRISWIFRDTSGAVATGRPHLPPQELVVFHYRDRVIVHGMDAYIQRLRHTAEASHANKLRAGSYLPACSAEACLLLQQAYTHGIHI